MTLDDLLRLCERLLDDLDVRGASARGLAVAMGLGEHVVLAPGQTLFTEDEVNDAIYVLLTGRVQLLLNDTRGVARHLVDLDAPALVGQVGIIERSPRDATCRATAQHRAGLVRLDRDLVTLTYSRPDEVGAAVRRAIGASMLQRLAAVHTNLSPLKSPARPPVLAEASPPDPDLAWLSGAIGDWAINADGLDEMEVVQTHDRPPPRSRDR